MTKKSLLLLKRKRRTKKKKEKLRYRPIDLVKTRFSQHNKIIDVLDTMIPVEMIFDKMNNNSFSSEMMLNMSHPSPYEYSYVKSSYVELNSISRRISIDILNIELISNEHV